MSFDDIEATRLKIQQDLEKEVPQKAQEDALRHRQAQIDQKKGEQSLRNRLKTSSENAFQKMNTLTSDGKKRISLSSLTCHRKKNEFTREEIIALVNYHMQKNNTNNIYIQGGMFD
ncbi:MAG: hypothetical protein IJS88_01115 [Alphaproteobacteria bacterium]|nr:hypothetical protein [Alphaproteobacteria bacterium]